MESEATVGDGSNSGELRVYEVNVEGLALDKGINAFVNFRLEGKESKSKGKQRSREVKCERGCTSVCWNEDFLFSVNDINQTLTLRIWDKTWSGSNPIGTLSVPITSFMSNLQADVDFNNRYKLPDNNAVQVHLRFEYKSHQNQIAGRPTQPLPPSTPTQSAPVKEDIGDMKIHIYGAAELYASDINAFVNILKLLMVFLLKNRDHERKKELLILCGMKTFNLKSEV